MDGLAGAHRTGKTSLAKAYAEKHGLTFLQTSVSAIFKDMGYDPAVTYDFSTRLTIQEEILKRLDKVFADQVGERVVADRTPLDFLAYTMAEAIGEVVSDEDQARFAKYTADCFECLNKRFSMLLIVQPGIALVQEEGKAVLNQAYIEHLNSLLLGLSVDERVKIPHFYVPRAMIDMDDRMSSLEFASNRVMQRSVAERDGSVIH